jgi:hypothetical protein
MQQDASPAPAIGDSRKLGGQCARILKRGRGISIPRAEALTWNRVIALIQLSAELRHEETIAMRFGRLLIGPDGVCPPSLSEEEKRYIAFLAPLEPGLKFLLCLLTYRCSLYVTGWREWLRELGHPLLSEPVLRSLLLAWLPWAGRAPPVVPEITPRQ